MDLVLASGNAGKLAELRELLGGDGRFTLRAQAEFGVDDVEETGLTFIENALLKARHAARATGLPALGDDSGLRVVPLPRWGRTVRLQGPHMVSSLSCFSFSASISPDATLHRIRALSCARSTKLAGQANSWSE